jgi:hypothetical protein
MGPQELTSRPPKECTTALCDADTHDGGRVDRDIQEYHIHCILRGVTVCHCCLMCFECQPHAMRAEINHGSCQIMPVPRHSHGVP